MYDDKKINYCLFIVDCLDYNSSSSLNSLGRCMAILTRTKKNSTSQSEINKAQSRYDQLKGQPYMEAIQYAFILASGKQGSTALPSDLVQRLRRANNNYSYSDGNYSKTAISELKRLDFASQSVYLDDDKTFNINGKLHDVNYEIVLIFSTCTTLIHAYKGFEINDTSAYNRVKVARLGKEIGNAFALHDQAKVMKEGKNYEQSRRL